MYSPIISVSCLESSHCNYLLDRCGTFTSNKLMHISKKMKLPQQFLKNTYILTNKFNIFGVGLFLMKSNFTVLIQIEEED